MAEIQNQFSKVYKVKSLFLKEITYLIFLFILQTDDQILLLQNCWSDLLLLECCYRSKEKPSEIRLAQGATLSVKTAKSLGLGSVVSMVVELAEQLNRLKVDLYEFVGLKVLVLITPGKGIFFFYQLSL